MPKPQERCEVTVNGRKFSDWDRVLVKVDKSFTECVLSVIEKDIPSFAKLQLKTGDECKVTLAGALTCTGRIAQRQVAYDARSHGVQVVIRSLTSDLVRSDAPWKQFKDKPAKDIIEDLIKPFGIKVVVKGETKNFGKKFKDFNVGPGLTFWNVIDQLCSMRGMRARDNEKGELVLANGSQGTAGDLVEGKNILSANCLIQDDTEFSTIGARSQQRGDDKTDDETARKPSGSTKGSVDRYKPRTVLSEVQGDAQDMADRAEYERRILLAATINCRITTQGWLKSNGDVWKWGETVTVKSPSLLFDKAALDIQSIVFSQDSQTGTTTTLELVRQDTTSDIGKSPIGLPGGDSVEQGTPEP